MDSFPPGFKLPNKKWKYPADVVSCDPTSGILLVGAGYHRRHSVRPCGGACNRPESWHPRWLLHEKRGETSGHECGSPGQASIRWEPLHRTATSIFADRADEASTSTPNRIYRGFAG